MSDAGWQPARARKPSIPVTLLAGPLGAGKTTLLNRLVREEAFADTVVILNEFGETILDPGTVAETGDGLVELGAGCVCCTIRGELVTALERLLRALDNGRIARIARIVVETGSMADPAPVFALLTRHPYLSLRFHLDGIIAVVGATADASPLPERLVAVADRIVLAGTDRNGDSPVLRAHLSALNPGAPLLDAARGEAHAATLTGTASDLTRWIAIDAAAAQKDAGTFVIVRDVAFSSAVLEAFLDEAVTRFGPTLLRVKGIVALDGSPDRPALVHGIGEVFALPFRLPAWPDGDRRTRLVVTALGLDHGAFHALFDAFSDTPAPDTPDRAAILDNPLAVAGFRPR